MAQYVALLRGINVGGNNIIKMAELKACFEMQGFMDVSTYIQSGNVVFASDGVDLAKLSSHVEAMLSQAFSYQSRVVVCSHHQMQKIVAGAPKGFGSEPAKYRYDVVFLRSPLTATAVTKDVSLKEGVDTVSAGQGVLYFSRLMAKAAQSRLPRLATMPAYKNMTIRNWNTTTKLLAIMNKTDD